MLEKAKEANLIHRCIRGDNKAQFELYQIFAAKMYGVCLRYIYDSDIAKDVLQEAFIKIFAKLDTFQGTGSLFSWMKTIVIRTALAEIRKDKLVWLQLEDQHPPIATENILSELATEEILQALHQLPDGYRLILNLYAIEGYSHQEISAMLQISESTSKSQLSRARISLKKNLNQINRLQYATTRKSI